LFGLSVGETILSVLGFFTLLAAALVVPEVRKALHLETDAPPAPAAPAQKIEEPTTSEQAKDPEPEFKTVPLPEKSAPKPVIQQAMNGSPNPDRSPHPFGRHPFGTGGSGGHGGRTAAAGSRPPTGVNKSTPEEILDQTYPFIRDSDAQKLLVHRVEPVFPPDASKEDLNYAELLVLVNAEGNVDAARRVMGKGESFDAVKRAVLQWKYKPYVVGGKATPFRTSVMITFPTDSQKTN
jgi:hypothetical protein